jgi:hypothetical protein
MRLGRGGGGRGGRGGGLGGIGGSKLIADETYLGVHGLAGLFEVSGDLGRASSGDNLAANVGLFRGKGDVRAIQSGARGIFEIAEAAASVGVEVFRREEPAIHDAQTGDASRFDQVHEVPVRHLQVSRRFVARQQPTQRLEAARKLFAAQDHMCDHLLRGNRDIVGRPGVMDPRPGLVYAEV